MLLNPFTSFVGRIYVYLYVFFHAHCTAMSGPSVALFVHLHLCVYIKDYWCAAKLCLSSLSQPESSALMWAASF